MTSQKLSELLDQSRRDEIRIIRHLRVWLVYKKENPSPICGIAKGFLKRKHVTLMIGTEDEKVDQAISIIQKYAGERKTVKYTNLAAPSGPISPGLNYTVPINVEVGGSTIFVMNVERFEKM